MSKKLLWILISAIVVAAVLVAYVTKKPAEQGTIKIGVLAPLTGNRSLLGERIRNGMELAKEDILREGAVKSIEIIYEDACLPKDAVSAAQKLVTLNKVSIIGGSLCLIGLVPVIPIAEQNKIITFNTAANPDSVLNKPYVFSTNVSIKSDAEKLADYAYNKLRARSAAIVYLNTPFGQDYNKFITASFESLGGKILTSETKVLDAIDFRTELTKIKASNPDVVFVIYLVNSLGNLLKQARELGIRSKILGHYEAEDPTVLKFAGEAAEGFTISSSEPTTKTEQITSFEQRYQKRFGSLPDVLASNAYDALNLQVIAYKKCSGQPDCMREELHKVNNYSGVSGVITILPDGSTAKPTVFKVVKNGKFVKIDAGSPN